MDGGVGKIKGKLSLLAIFPSGLTSVHLSRETPEVYGIKYNCTHANANGCLFF